MIRHSVNIGDKFGRLTVISEGKQNSHSRFWLCRCECGTEKYIQQTHLTAGATQSCGCYRREWAAEKWLKHGDTRGENISRLYRIWASMLRRCLNKKYKRYKDYGGRGITICHEWLEYPAFREWASTNGYNDNLTIERIDVNGNYEPSNCCWIPLEKQALNRRNSFIFNGKPVLDWANELGISYQTIRSRFYHRGWPLEKAIFTPTRKKQE